MHGESESWFEMELPSKDSFCINIVKYNYRDLYILWLLDKTTHILGISIFSLNEGKYDSIIKKKNSITIESQLFSQDVSIIRL